MADKKRIELGMVYSAKVGGGFVAVRADKSLGHGRYEGTTVRTNGTGSKVKFTTDSVRGDGQTEQHWRDKSTPVPHDLPAPKPAQQATAKPAAARKACKPAGPRKLSGLDAAVQVLAEAGKPMNTADMVKRMLDTGLWKTNGKTPAATIYAAIITEISKKGDKSRFRKTDRGMFEIAK